jgi:hypothetical protein
MTMSERTAHGFRIGAINVEALTEYNGYASVRVTIGDAIITLEATPKGHKAGIAIDDGSTAVRVARRRKGGKWE